MIKKILPENLSDAMTLFSNVVNKMQELGIDQWDNEYPSMDIISEDLKEGYAFGYFLNSKLAAYVALNEKYDIEYDDIDWDMDSKFIVVHRLAVDPSYQGKGLAKEMMIFAEKFAIQEGYKAIKLDTYCKNPIACRLYPSLNYQLKGSVVFRKGDFFVYEKIL